MSTEMTPRRISTQVFATSNFTLKRWVQGRSVHQPTNVVHGKTMGTTTTLCGLSALSWQKFLDIPFATVQRDRCPTCETLFQRQLAAEAKSPLKRTALLTAEGS